MCEAAPEPLDLRDDSRRTGDKSCGTCKRRKVRCDRTYRKCKKCTRRNETCVYPDNTTFEGLDGGPVRDNVRFALLKSEVASLVERLNSNTAATAPHTPPVACPVFFEESFPDLSSSILVALVSGSDSEGACLRLSEYLHECPGLETAPAVAHSHLGRLLVVTLIEAFYETSWSRLPAFQVLSTALAPYDFTQWDVSLDAMDPAAQVALVVLCALGASCKPQSGVFGFRLDLETASLADIAVVGATREHAFHGLGNLAWDLAGRLGLFWDLNSQFAGTERGWHQTDRSVVIGVLLGWSQWLTFQDIRPVRSRWLLQNALNLFKDLESGCGEDLRVLKHTFGSVFMNLDATISSHLLTAPLVPPRLAHDFLQQASDLLARSPQTTRDNLDVAIVATRWSISECQARFTSAVLPTPNAVSHSPFPSIRFLWQTIDNVHGSVQSLMEVLSAPQVYQGDDRTLDDYTILAVRLDLQLIEICNSVHAFLGRAELEVPGREAELVAMREESDQRVRKCLKVVAFYYQLFLSSGDKYLGSHLVVQLDLLPDWTTLATQRVGWVPGPSGPEFELSEEELDWITTGLRSACFFATAPAIRLQEVSDARKQSSSRYTYGANPPQFSREPLASPSSSASTSYGVDCFSSTISESYIGSVSATSPWKFE